MLSSVHIYAYTFFPIVDGFLKYIASPRIIAFLTSTSIVEDTPDAVVTVIVVLPFLTAVISPLRFTFATDVSALVHESVV